MRIPQSTAEMVLANWSARSIDVRRRPVEVSCLDGQVLVTFEGDPVDHVLAAGDAFRVQGRGRLVVAALRPSTVRVAVVQPREAAMAPERLTFKVRGRGILSGVGLFALYAALATGFVASASRPVASPRLVAEQRLATPGPSLALCFCPDAAAVPQLRP